MMKLIQNDTDLTGIDCHVHSMFSPDAKAMGAYDPDGIVGQVRRKGLRGFIVTDHIDVGHWGGKVIDFDEYFRVWDSVRKRNPDLVIYIGLEVGFEPQYAEKAEALIKDLPLEYVINSVHYWNNPNWSLGMEKTYCEYLKAVSASLDVPYEFNAVGHLGFPERYAPYENRAMEYERFKPLMDEIIKKAVARGVRFEQNTNGGGEMRLPREGFLRAYNAAGGMRPMLGSDAHNSVDIGRYFEQAKEFLDGIF